ncbi:MAG: Secretion system C-terminal sorting domain [Bacteroidetes bacterium]|jgi:hypothetical protein|nr:Secretion system C-terminal sorting domain [Bacteroidota bacterium]
MEKETIKLLKLLKNRLLLFLLVACRFSVFSQDIKSGYMSIHWINGYTYADTTYLLIEPNNDTYRPYILVNWGVKIDTSKLVQTIALNNSILKKYYGTCSFPGPGYYLIKYQDSFRISAIRNIVQSDAQNIELTTLLNIQTFGSIVNSAPTYFNKNLTLSVSNDSVIFKPLFEDFENDSLSFQLTHCFASSYYTPVGSSIDGNGNVSFQRDSIGIYAFSLIVKEWRDNNDDIYVNIQSSQLDFVMNITPDVSVAEEKRFANSLFPNPTTSILYFADDYNEFKNFTIEIKNWLGQSVYSSLFTSQIDMSNFSTGMYFLTIKDMPSFKPVKIIKD